MINKLKRKIKLIGVIAIVLLLSFNVQKIIEWKKDSKETKNIIEKGKRIIGLSSSEFK